MSAMELRNFESQLDLLSYAEQLAVIEYLVKSMRKRKSAKKPRPQTWLSDTFKIMDSHPVHSEGRKWTREELYER